VWPLMGYELRSKLAQPKSYAAADGIGGQLTACS
jgi:hypothetical protein